MSTADYNNFPINRVTDFSDVNAVYGPGAYKKWDKDQEKEKNESRKKKMTSFHNVLEKEEEKEKDEKKNKPGQLGSFFEAKV